jgi:hypothetical protein
MFSILPSRTSHSDVLCRAQKCIDLCPCGHGWRGAGASDGKARGGATEAYRLDRVTAFGNGHRKATVEGIPCPGGFHDRASVEGWNMLADDSIVVQRALFTQA